MSTHFSKPLKKNSEAASLITIVASQYNGHLVDAMLEQAQKEILAIQPKTVVEVVRVPGAFEIPLFVKLVAERRRPDAIIALGVLLQGETAHANLVATSVSKALQDIAIEYSTPVVHQVLLLNNEEQAIARCMTDTLNRGVEAARVAVAVVHAARDIQPRN
ncbi:MAG: 6,7-dimethyl-8-ribityllumazine synthase [Chthoniobacterales bacterium]